MRFATLGLDVKRRWRMSTTDRVYRLLPRLQRYAVGKQKTSNHLMGGGLNRFNVLLPELAITSEAQEAFRQPAFRQKRLRLQERQDLLELCRHL